VRIVVFCPNEERAQLYEGRSSFMRQLRTEDSGMLSCMAALFGPYQVALAARTIHGSLRTFVGTQTWIIPVSAKGFVTVGALKDVCGS